MPESFQPKAWAGHRADVPVVVCQALVEPAKTAILFGNEKVSYHALRRRALAETSGFVADSLKQTKVSYDAT